MDVAIIGTGNMANGIGTRLVAGNHTVTIYHNSAEKAKQLAEKLGGSTKGEKLGEEVNGDIVILALPYNTIFDVIEKYKNQLQGKVLIDISNPIDFQINKLIPPPNSSGTEEIAKKLPQDTKLVKAFNTTFAGTLVKGEVDGKQLDVFIASDNEEAKKLVSELVKTSGMRVLDAGPLANARALEGLGYLHITMQEKLGNTWMTAIKILP